MTPMLTHAPPTAAPLTGRGMVAGLLALAHGQQPVEDLSAELSSYLGSRATFLADSGRTSLFVLVRALYRSLPKGEASRRRVILPAYSCPAVAQVVKEAGLDIRLVDVDPATLDYDPDALNRAFDDRTLAVVLIHPLGLPRPVAPVLALARQAGAWLIEDVAQSLGAILADGKPAGSLGDFALSSFGPGKPISAGGGGALSANTVDAARLATTAWQDLRSPSQRESAAAWLRAFAFDLAFRPTGWWLVSQLGVDRAGDSPSSWGFRERRLSGAQAALARDGLRHLAEFVAARRCHASSLLDALVDHPRIRTVHGGPPSSKPAYLRLPVLVTDTCDREDLYSRLRKAGIGVGKLYPSALSNLFPNSSPEGTFPGAEHIAHHILTLPTHPRLTSNDLDRMTAVLRSAV